MRILLTGTRSFGAAAYTALCAYPSWVGTIEAVVAPPDDKLAAAARANQQIVEPDISEALVRDLDIDLIVAAHSHAFIGQRSRRAARYGAIGYHPSLLPRHRGKDAVRWTIHMGDPVAGGTVYWFTNSVDCGPIQCQDFVLVDPSWDHHDLWSKALFPMGVNLLVKACTDIHAGSIRQVDQDPRAATWEPSWERPPVHRPELVELGDGNGHDHMIQKDRWPGHPVGMM